MDGEEVYYFRLSNQSHYHHQSNTITRLPEAVFKIFTPTENNTMETVAIPKEEPGLFEKAGEYAETQLQLLKYRAIDTGAEVVSSLMTRLTVILLFATFIFILNIGLALWIGYLLGQSYYGFFIVAGFYALMALLFYSFRHPWLKKPLNDLLVRKILKPKP